MRQRVWSDLKDVVCITEVFTEHQDLRVSCRNCRGFFRKDFLKWLFIRTSVLISMSIMATSGNQINAKWMFYKPTHPRPSCPQCQGTCPSQGWVNLQNKHVPRSGSVCWLGRKRFLLLHPQLEGRYQHGCVWASAVRVCFSCRCGRFECHQACLKLRWCMHVDVECCQVEDVCACESATF